MTECSLQYTHDGQLPGRLHWLERKKQQLIYCGVLTAHYVHFMHVGMMYLYVCMSCRVGV